MLFCDLVDSTQIAAQLDAEDWREIAAAYQRTAADAVKRFAGNVAKYLGDGLVCFFGVPQAHEDDAERAVRAALAIVEAVRELNAKIAPQRVASLHVRVGLHTGTAVFGQGGGDEQDVFGETPHIASRVQAVAEPDTVLITAATQRLVAGVFLVEDRGPHTLKGIPHPMVLYRVRHSSGVRGRLALHAARSLTPFVGRDDERRLLMNRWKLAEGSEGQVVLITGEAGIGKSRLARQFKEDLGHTPHTWIECGGSPFSTHTPLYTASELLQHGLAWQSDVPSESRAAELERTLRAINLEPKEVVPLIAPLLNLALPDGYPPLLLSPEQRRRKLFGTLLAWVLATARLQPTVILVEDLHWVDPSTLELSGLLVEQAVTVPLMLIFTARPGVQTTWPVRSYHTQLILNRLSKHHVRQMIMGVTSRIEPAAAVIEMLVARTDGVPLFVEELTRAVVEAGVATVAEPQIPTTLQDSLMARLDRLGPAKDVAQIAAVVGREFSYPLLQAVVGLPEPELQAALEKLVDAELVHMRGVLPDALYLFKHALVREAAYDSLLKTRRRELHGAVARVLTEQFHETVAVQPELVAQHWTAAGQAEPAVAAWQAAAERSVARAALAEAAGHYLTALEVLGTLPQTPARMQHELSLQAALGPALWATKGWGSPEAAQAFARARQLGEQLGDAQQLVYVLLGLWAAPVTRGELRAAQELADQLLQVAERDNSPATLVWAHFAQGTVRYYRADLTGARTHLDRALAYYDREHHRWAATDPGVNVLALSALTAWQLGLADQARLRMQDSLDLARRLDKPYDVAVALTQSCAIHILLREPQCVLADVELLMKLATEQQFPLFLAVGTIGRGWALANQGQCAEGIAQLRHGLGIFVSVGQRLSHGLYLGLLADAYQRAGAVEDGLSAVQDALGAVPEEAIHCPDLLRLEGELHRQLNRGQDAATERRAEDCFREAIQLARAAGAKSQELRATTSLSRLLLSQGCTAEARQTLAPLYASFSEGFDTLDLRDARALLQEQ